jgi:phospholipid/cholesterol/gamma-HCH transport system ATP-binding protein
MKSLQTSEFALSAHAVSKAFEGRSVLKNLSLDVHANESMVVMGQSGVGKSVLLQCFLGFCTPESGQCWIGGKEVAKETNAQQASRFKNSGVVFQSCALFDSLTLWENVAFRIQGHDQKRRAEAIEILESVGLAQHTADLYPSEISGGMKRRTSIARAISMNPKFLFFDEPTEGLDPISTTVISQLIRTVITRLKATAFTITHNVQSASLIGDHIALLHDGHITWKGTPEEMQTSSNHYVHHFVNGIPFPDDSKTT